MDPSNKDDEKGTVEIQIESNNSIANDKAFLIEEIIPQNGSTNPHIGSINIFKKFWLGLKYAIVLIALVGKFRFS